MSCYVCKGKHDRLWLVLTDGVHFYIPRCDVIGEPMGDAWLCALHYAKAI